MEIARELDSVANEITFPGGVKLKRKVDRRKQVGRRVIKSQHVTLYDRIQSLWFGVAIGTKIGLA